MKNIYNRIFVSLYWCYGINKTSSKVYNYETGAFDILPRTDYLFRTMWQHFWDIILDRKKYLKQYITNG